MTAPKPTPADPVRIGLDDGIYVVTDPGSHSVVTDILHETTLHGFMRRAADGMGPGSNPVIYTEQYAAHEDASHRLLARRAADWIRTKRGLPAGEAVCVVLFDRDGSELYRGELK